MECKQKLLTRMLQWCVFLFQRHYIARERKELLHVSVQCSSVFIYIVDLSKKPFVATLSTRSIVARAQILEDPVAPYVALMIS